MGWAVRPRGERSSASRWSWGSSSRAPAMGVSMGPGWTELTRMFSRAYCTAADLVKMRTAPLEAL